MRVRLLLGVAILALLGCPLAQAGAPPNLIIILTDDQGYGDVSAHGNPHLKTPHLDQLRAEGTALDRFYVSPVCSPTRASLMTARYNYRTGVVDTYIGRSMMHASEVTLAERLRDAGYRTGIFGKWHLGDTYPLRAMDQGFEESLVCRGGGIGQPSDPPDNDYFNPRLQHNGVEKAYTGYCTDVYANAALDFMQADDARPFFVYFTPVTPHVPLTVDDAYVKPFLDMGLDEETARVYGMVVNIDENVGRMLDALEAMGQDDNTLVLFLTDNGPAYHPERAQRHRANLNGRKGEVLEGGIRVPCFLRWPGTVPAGQVITDTAAHIDLAPTLLEALGVPLEPEAALDGRSVWSRILGGPSLPERLIFLQWHRGDAPTAYTNAAVVGQRFKLINGEELRDLETDPAETTVFNEQHPEVVARLRAAYDTWFADVSSTRGYAPPRILLAPDAAPVTLLTPQDWRGSADFGPTNASHWEVSTREGGHYTVTLDFTRSLDNAVAELRIGGKHYTTPVPEGATTISFSDIPLPPNTEDRLAFQVTHESEGKAVRYATFTRAEE